MLQERSDKYLWLFDAVFFLVSTVVFESIDWHEFKLTLAIMLQAVRATTNFYSHFPGLQSVILILKREILCRASAAWLRPYCALLTEKERDKRGREGREAPAIMRAAGRVFCRPSCPVWQAASVLKPLMASDVSRSGTRVVLIPVWPRW